MLLYLGVNFKNMINYFIITFAKKYNHENRYNNRCSRLT